MIIAIDGTTASGKGTLARRLAARFALPYLDTGLLYRATAAAALRAGIDPADAAEVSSLAAAIRLDDYAEDELRSASVGAWASVAASLGPVRAALFDLQRAFARRPGGAVLDGRDIGTVIAPDADFKFWVDAAIEVRAERRHRELIGRGETATPEGVLAAVRERDARDASRKDAPSKPAEDAVLIDSTFRGPDEVMAAALEIMGRGKAG